MLDSSSKSDSNDDTSGSEFDDGYDDDLMGDEEDRRMLNEMTEMKREQILFERYEKREELQKRFINYKFKIDLFYYLKLYAQIIIIIIFL